MAKDLEYYLAQARRIAEHREKDAEKEIRKLYKKMLKDLQTFMSETYVKYAEEDKLTYAMLQKAGYDARFLEEIEKQLNLSTPKAAKELRKLVEDTYEAAYNQMVKGVSLSNSVSLDEAFKESINITPDQIKRAVENPVSGLTLSDILEKNRREIIYSIKQTIGVGLMNGDRYTTMAKRIAEHLDGDYKKAIRIARTEAHRVLEAGNIDAAVRVEEELKNGTTGMRMVKTWRSMKDERVRPQIRRKRGRMWTTTMGNGANHMVMEGQVRLAEEEFDLGGGVKAMAPGLSGDAGNDINCRCYASYEMMTDEQYYKLTGKHFANKPVKEWIPSFADYEKDRLRSTVLSTGTHDFMEIFNMDEAALKSAMQSHFKDAAKKADAFRSKYKMPTNMDAKKLSQWLRDIPDSELPDTLAVNLPFQRYTLLKLYGDLPEVVDDLKSKKGIALYRSVHNSRTLLGETICEMSNYEPNGFVGAVFFGVGLYFTTVDAGSARNVSVGHIKAKLKPSAKIVDEGDIEKMMQEEGVYGADISTWATEKGYDAIRSKVDRQEVGEYYYTVLRRAALWIEK